MSSFDEHAERLLRFCTDRRIKLRHLIDGFTNARFARFLWAESDNGPEAA